MNPLITGIEEDITDHEARIATHKVAIENLKVALEETQKPKFKPFDVVIRVSTLKQALGLRELSFWPCTVAEAIDANEIGKFDEIATAMLLLSVLRQQINDEGNYRA